MVRGLNKVIQVTMDTARIPDTPEPVLRISE